jgi:hypothetical protein
MADDPQQRDPDIIAYSSFNGLRNDVTPERYSQGDLEVADNIDIDLTGRISRRAGMTLQALGAWHSLWADQQQVSGYVAQGNTLYSIGPAFVLTLIAALKAGNHISFFKVNDRTYFTNEVDTGVIEQAAVRSWGVAPPNLPAVSIGTGSMSAGTYQFVMTYVRQDGQESGARAAGIVQVATDGAGLNFSSMPSSIDPTVVAKNLYLSPPNGEQMFLALVLGNSVGTAAYTGDCTEFNVPLDSQFLLPAPAGQLIAFYRGRMWVAKDDVIYPSQPFDYERFDLREYIQMDGRVTLLAPMTDKEQRDDNMSSSGFFVGTDRSCGVMIGGNPDEFQYIPKANYGAVPGTMAMVDGSLYQDGAVGMRELPMWVTTQGICVGMPDLAVKNLTRTRYTFDVGQQGAALFLSEPNRFIATSST